MKIFLPKRCLAFALFICYAAFTAAAPRYSEQKHRQIDRPAHIDTIVTAFRDAMYRQVKSDEELNGQYTTVVSRLEESDLSKQQRLFFLAEAEYFMGRSYQSFDDPQTVAAHFRDTLNGEFLSLKNYYNRREKALRHYSAGLEILKEYLRSFPTSQGYRLCAELLGQMVLLEDVGFLLQNGPKIGKYIDEALHRNPVNTKARILEAGESIYTPRVFGGRPQKGIEMLSDIACSLSTDREDRFNIYSGIGYGYAVLNDREAALHWFDKALDVYPGNVFAGGMIEVMEEP